MRGSLSAHFVTPVFVVFWYYICARSNFLYWYNRYHIWPT